MIVCHVKIHSRRDHEKYSVKLVVVLGCPTPLLGAKAAKQMKLITVNTENFCPVTAVKEERERQVRGMPTILVKLSWLTFKKFYGDLGKFQGMAHLQVNAAVTPEVSSSRKVPETLNHSSSQSYLDLPAVALLHPYLHL